MNRRSSFPIAILAFGFCLASAQAESSQRVVVSIADRKLTLLKDGREIGAWDIAVGKPSTPSPEGTMTVVNRVKNPTWFGPGGKVIGPGAANPVGTRWVGLSKKGYGIHGTNEPGSIGKAASHGCIRMRNRDVEQFFDLVETGAVVEFSGVSASAD
jgi:lipoprotein-anchoring transpeptidase ErfK/SrfK